MYLESSKKYLFSKLFFGKSRTPCVINCYKHVTNIDHLCIKYRCHVENSETINYCIFFIEILIIRFFNNKKIFMLNISVRITKLLFSLQQNITWRNGSNILIQISIIDDKTSVIMSNILTIWLMRIVFILFTDCRIVISFLSN